MPFRNKMVAIVDLLNISPLGKSTFICNVKILVFKMYYLKKIILFKLKSVFKSIKFYFNFNALRNFNDHSLLLKNIKNYNN